MICLNTCWRQTNRRHESSLTLAVGPLSTLDQKGHPHLTAAWEGRSVSQVCFGKSRHFLNQTCCDINAWSWLGTTRISFFTGRSLIKGYHHSEMSILSWRCVSLHWSPDVQPFESWSMLNHWLAKSFQPLAVNPNLNTIQYPEFIWIHRFLKCIAHSRQHIKSGSRLSGTFTFEIWVPWKEAFTKTCGKNKTTAKDAWLVQVWPIKGPFAL